MIYFLRCSHLSWRRAAVTLTHGALTDSQLYKIAQRPPFIMKPNCQHSEAGTWRELWGNICSLKWRGNKVVSVPPSCIRLVPVNRHSLRAAGKNKCYFLCAHRLQSHVPIIQNDHSEHSGFHIHQRGNYFSGNIIYFTSTQSENADEK